MKALKQPQGWQYIIDGISGDANLFASKMRSTLNFHSTEPCSSSVNASLSFSQLEEVCFSEEDIVDAIGCLASQKYDAIGISAEHLKFATPVVSDISSLFTAILRHGYMPKCFRDSVLVPIPKSRKDASRSDNYRPIALSPTLSKVLEHIIVFVLFCQQ